MRTNKEAFGDFHLSDAEAFMFLKDFEDDRDLDLSLLSDDNFDILFNTVLEQILEYKNIYSYDRDFVNLTEIVDGLGIEFI